jgi:hypothetical protein
MDWFKQKTSKAGVQVSNWMIVLGVPASLSASFERLK